MKQRRFTEKPIFTILTSVEDGQKVSDVCHANAISEATHYRWKSTYGGMGVSQVQRLRHREAENRQLKHIVADLTLDNAALKDVIEKRGNARIATSSNYP